MIAEYPSLEAVEKKIVVHDAAANMKAAIPLMEQNAITLLCADHLMNTSLQAATAKVLLLDEAIKAATALSSKVHQSTLACKSLMDECEKVGCEYVKLISPVVTRWNSNYMLIESVLRVKTALRSLREQTENVHFRGIVPTDNQFSILENVSKILKFCKIISEQWSKDNEPVMHMFLASVDFLDFQIKGHANTHRHAKKMTSDVVVEFAKHLTDALFSKTRINDKGKKFYIDNDILLNGFL